MNILLPKINRFIIAHKNINSLQNKSDFLVEQIKGNIDLLMVLEIKLNESFPQSQLKITSFSTAFRLGRNNSRGGVILVVREDIPASRVLRVMADKLFLQSE